MATFLSGADLAHGFYEDVVRPILGRTTHSAALLGTGSDVLGFDTARSTDHGWGPRMHPFVDEADVAEVATRVEGTLPETYRGWPTRYGWDVGWRTSWGPVVSSTHASNGCRTPGFVACP